LLTWKPVVISTSKLKILIGEQIVDQGFCDVISRKVVTQRMDRIFDDFAVD
jgi:hypothetical protein